MDDEQSEQDAALVTAPPHPQQQSHHDAKGTVAETLALLQQARSVTGRPRQVYVGGLLGVCLVFLVALVGVPRLDTPLQVALFAFVIGMVLLLLDLMFITIRFGPGLSKGNEWITTGLDFAAWIIGDGFGCLAVLVGVAAVVRHLSGWALLIGLLTLVLGTLGIMVLMMAYVLYQAWRETRTSPSSVSALQPRPQPQPVDAAPAPAPQAP